MWMKIDKPNLISKMKKKIVWNYGEPSSKAKYMCISYSEISTVRENNEIVIL
jgi:hypothetical protein